MGGASRLLFCALPVCGDDRVAAARMDSAAGPGLLRRIIGVGRFRAFARRCFFFGRPAPGPAAQMMATVGAAAIGLALVAAILEVSISVRFG